MKELRELIIAKTKQLLNKNHCEVDDRDIQTIDVATRAYATVKMHDEQDRFNRLGFGAPASNTDAE